jgi:hypothetical protein
LIDRPFDKQPLFGTWSTQPLLVAMGRAHSDRAKREDNFTYPRAKQESDPKWHKPNCPAIAKVVQVAG